MEKSFKILIFIIVLFILFPKDIYAHPGNTASDGCHYCWTNCDYWGEVYGERHCHNGSSNSEDDSNYEEGEGEDNTIYWLIGLGFVGYFGYQFGKKNK
jgi:hypothetical protein